MSVTLSLPLALTSSPAPAGDGPGSVDLAALLAEVGTAIEPLVLESLAPETLATLTAHLLDGAGALTAFTPDRATRPIASLRALGVLAARTTGTAVPFPAARAAKVRTLLGELTAA